MIIVKFHSEEFGADEIPQDTIEEAAECVKRLILKADSLKDGIERTYSVVTIKD